MVKRVYLDILTKFTFFVYSKGYKVLFWMLYKLINVCIRRKILISKVNKNANLKKEFNRFFLSYLNISINEKS